MNQGLPDSDIDLLLFSSVSTHILMKGVELQLLQTV